MSAQVGHLGNRVSALLDGQMPVDEADRAWAHVYACHVCRDRVEREGWVKSRLARLGDADPGAEGGASDRLKGALAGLTPADVSASLAAASRGAGRRPGRTMTLAAVGSGAVGAAVVGVLALGTAPADAPITSITPVSQNSPATGRGGATSPEPGSQTYPAGIRRPR